MNHPSGRWAARCSSTGFPLLALCIQHADGTVHIRSTTLGYGKAASALQAARVQFAWVPDLHCDPDSGQVWPYDLRVTAAGLDDELRAGDVADVLLDAHAGAVLAYEAFYDGTSVGPVTKYRRSATSVPSPTTSRPWIAAVDYGFDAGCWFFGAADVLAEAVDAARSLGLTQLYLLAEPGGVDSFALPGGADVERLAGLLQMCGWLVWQDAFTPVDDEADSGPDDGC